MRAREQMKQTKQNKRRVRAPVRETTNVKLTKPVRYQLLRDKAENSVPWAPAQGRDQAKLDRARPGRIAQGRVIEIATKS